MRRHWLYVTGVTTDPIFPNVQVAIGKMFDMFIVHDHEDLRLMKVIL
jgi:hypothetical protein